VAYSRDGKRFASGGADKTIIIWTSKCEGILKYSHNESIQALAYNPVTQQLASATAIDFGLWSPEQKTVTKEKVSAKVLSASWTNDGQYLALGQFNGHISIRDRQGQEKVRIERSAPIWSLQWSPVRPDGVDVLAVGCWDKTLSFYQLSGAQLGKDRELKYDPCSLSYFGDGEYLLIGGSDRKVNLMTKEGVFLSTVAEREDWVWSVKARPKHKFLAVGCNDGTIATYQTLFSTVHGLFQDRYAYRDTMTDVIIQHLSTEQKVRIKTRDFVKKIAIYRDRLAVQLPDRVLIYETNGGATGDENDMHYRLKEKIVKKMDCNLLVVTSQHIILCQEKKLQLHSFKGRKVREWTLEAVIRYIKVIGGPPGREGLLVGLKNGQVLKIFVDNRFPVLLIRHRAAIRCLDLSASKRRMAVVDENSKVFIYDLLTKEITFEESNATSVAWNSELEEMFCFSGNGQLSIKTGDFPIHRQKLQGFVVGFKASKIFCLHFISMQTIDVPQSASMHRYLERNDYESALRVACLGVTESDWRDLANEALQGLALPIARKAFIRVRDMRFIELLNRIELTRRQQGSGGKPVDDSAFLADILAYQGHYDEASRLYLRSGQRRKAVEMYLDLRDWEKAKEIVESAPAGDNGDDAQFFNLPELLKRQAQWLLEVNDARAAQEMFWAAKDYSTAIQIIGEHQWLDVLIEKCRSLNKSERKALSQAAAIFRDAGNHQYAKEVYLKLDDAKALMKLHVELQKWDEAFALVSQNPDLQENIYAPYAEWLAINDRFDEAQVWCFLLICLS
jgi:intraflagellar transport protein 122